MMFHINAIATRAIGYYGLSLSVTSRRDLSAHYIRIMGGVLKYAKDGINIMIDHGWMEQPPQMIDHDKLANT